MTQRFAIEFLIASVATAVSVTAISPYLAPEDTFESFFWGAIAMTLGVAIAQWLVLRRYVSWAQWWVHATVLGDFVTSAVVSFLLNLTDSVSTRTDRTQVLVMLAIGLGGALAQFPILHRRVKDAWLWLVACGGTQALVYVVLHAAFPGGVDAETGVPGSVYRAAHSTLNFTVQATVLAWLLREELAGSAPRRIGYTALEFLIAWCAVPMTIYKIAQALQYTTEISSFRLALMVVLLAGGHLWVLSSVAAITTVERRIMWVGAAVVAWAVGFSVQHLDINGPVIVGVIAGLATGGVLLLTNRAARSAVAVEPSSTERRL